MIHRVHVLPAGMMYAYEQRKLIEKSLQLVGVHETIEALYTSFWAIHAACFPPISRVSCTL